MLSIVGLDKAEVLAALYNASRPQGMGFMQYTPEPMTSREARELLAQNQYFDYLKGRVMKLSLKDDAEFEERLYDRDNGSGSAARVIATLRDRPGLVNAPEVREAHHSGKMDAAASVKANLGTPSTLIGNVATLGLADVADQLGPAVDKAIS